MSGLIVCELIITQSQRKGSGDPGSHGHRLNVGRVNRTAQRLIIMHHQDQVEYPRDSQLSLLNAVELKRVLAKVLSQMGCS